MARKVRFGMKNVKYALWDQALNEGAGGYGEFKAWPGAVSWSMSREGGDASDFYADDGIYFTFAGTNGGYSADLECATVPDTVRVDLLGEVLDEGTGVQFETTDGEAPQFAIAFETTVDNSTMGFVFYNCKASRIEWSANTKSDSPDVDTDTLNIRIAAQKFNYKGSEKPFVQGHIEKTADNTAKYTAFFNGVVVPTAAA